MDTSEAKLPKPRDVKKRKRKNHSRRNATRSRARMIRELDAIARQEIVVERDQDTCQRCRKVNGAWDAEIQMPVVIQWSHYQTREYRILRWEPENSMALCSRCHKWFDNNKVLSFDWFAKNFPERDEMVKRVLRGNCKMSDADIRELWQARAGEAGK